MPKLRLGVALLLPPPTGPEVNGLRRALGDRSLERIPPHLTLVPPVNVRVEHLGTALAVLRAAAAATPDRLNVTLGPPASFLPANPVLYLPVSGGDAGVAALRSRVWAPPLIRSLSWSFVPHVTLADDASSEKIVAATAALGSYQVEVTFDRVHLLVERHPGPRWASLADVAFGPPAVVAHGPLAVELVRSHRIDPEGQALIEAEGAPLHDAAAEADPDADADADADSVVVTADANANADADADSMVVTARREGEVVGVGRAWRTPDGCRSAVLVAAPHRRQGIGRYIDAALEMAVIDAGWGCRYPRLTAGD